MALVVRIRASALVALALLCGAAAQDYSNDYSYDYYDYPPGSYYDYPPIGAPPSRRTSLAITTFSPTTIPQTSLPVTTFATTTIPQTSLAITTFATTTIPQTSLASRHQLLPTSFTNSPSAPPPVTTSPTPPPPKIVSPSPPPPVVVSPSPPPPKATSPSPPPPKVVSPSPPLPVTTRLSPPSPATTLPPAPTGGPIYLSQTVPSSGFKVGDTINLFGNFDTSCTVFIGNAYCDTTYTSSSQLSVKACATGQVGVLCDGNIVLRSGSSSTPVLEAVAPMERVRVGNMMSFTGLNLNPSCEVFVGNKYCPTSFFTSKYLLATVCAPGRVGLRCASTTMWTEVQVRA
eukprot:gene29640-18278_t